MNSQGTYNEITRHAEKRLRQRLGLPKRAIKRHIEIVMNDGLRPRKTAGSLHYHISKTIGKYDRRCDNPIIYGHHLYLFRGCRLITVLDLPNSIKPLAEYFLKTQE